MKNKKHIFSEEEIASVKELGDVLRYILQRLISEGKAKIVDGKVVFLDPKEPPK